jgi:TPR repeat protein
MICKKCGKQIEDNVKFCTYCGVPVENQTIAPKNSDLSLNANEQEYLEEFKICLEEDGEISVKTRRLLNRLRDKLGISEEKASEIESFVSTPSFTEEEQEYFDELKICLEEDGEISERERKLLNKIRSKLNISEERADEIEQLISPSIKKNELVNVEEISIEQLKVKAEQGNAVAQDKLSEMYYNDQDYTKSFEWGIKAAKQGYANAQVNIGYLYDEGIGVKQDYTKAMEWYLKAAEQGVAMAQCYLGNMYGDGNGVKQDYAKAMEWYRKAAEQGNTIAQYNVGYYYYEGLGVKQDYAKAMEWFLKVAEQGDADAQCRLGDMYGEGEGMKQDYAKAMEWYLKAAEQGNDVAQYSLGVMYYVGLGVEEDEFKAMKWHLKAAEQGNSNAQKAIGDMYSNGDGVVQDNTKAMEWYLKAAEQGNPDAQYSLGIMYYVGEGVEQDYTKAMKWYKKAAEQGNSDAQYFLGVMYYVGQGVEQDNTKAMEWYLKAAEQGNSNAQYSLGDKYYVGQGVEQDYTKAMKWYLKAAEQGNSDAQYSLGVMYYVGQGVEKDISKARKWYQAAAEQGNENAKKKLIDISDEKDNGIESLASTVQPQEEETTVVINCKNCGENFRVENQDDWKQTDLYYTCNKCQAMIETEFFGYCYNCEQYVGFRPIETSNFVLEFAKGALKGWLNPIESIKLLERCVDNIPDASADGICPFCNQGHLKCPQCGVSVQYPIDADDTTVITCKNCKTKMRRP